MRSIPGRRDDRGARRSASMTACAVAAALLSVPPACSGGLAGPIPAEHGAGAPPEMGGTLRLASFQDVRGLDPAGPGDALAQQAQHLLFAGLVDYDERAHIVADLADHWDVADDARTYRFFLRPGVTMHDGEELTAGDVKRSVERALHPSTPNPNASYFENLSGYEAYAAGASAALAGVVVEGRYVVTFRLARPDATFLSVLALHTLRPVCKTAGDRYLDTWAPCGAGPFKLSPGGWQRGIRLRLVRHEGYFRPALPYLDAIEWTFNVQTPSQRFRFEDGSLDLLRDLTQLDQARFAGDPRWRSLGIPEADRRVYGESMNTRMEPFDNVEVRRAVAAAIDREHYRLLKPAFITVLTQLMPPGISDYDPSVRGQRHDYAAALRHMASAGYPYDPATGLGGWPKPIVYPIYDRGLLVYTAQLLAQDLAAIGLRIQLKLVSWPAFLALQQRPGGAALSQANWEMDYPDASSLFEPLFTTDSLGSEATYNSAFYSNLEVDDLVAHARRERDPGRRKGLYRRANEIVCDEAPWAFAFSYHPYDVRQPYVRGFEPHPVWSLDATRIWIDRAARRGSELAGRTRAERSLFAQVMRGLLP